MKDPVTISKNSGGYVCFSQDSKGWPGSGFRSQRSEISMRRVVREEGGGKEHDELQISFGTYTVYEKTSRSSSGFVTIPASQIDQFLAAITDYFDPKKP